MMNTFPSTTSAGSLFGNQQPASTSLFGAPKPAGSLFGTNTTQQSGGLFGQQSTSSGFGTAGGGILGANKPATSAFGQVSQPNIFGQPPQQQGGGLFGSISTAAPTFGSTTTSTSMFGSNTVSSSFGGFGQQPQQPQAGGLFGQKPASSFGSFASGQQTQQPFGGAPVSTGSSMFGSQPTTGGGLFGQSNTGVQKPLTLFGSGPTSQQTGSFTTATKFTPPTGSDTMQLKGNQTQVNTKQMCISAMKDYETRSLEEIRCIDYVGGKKVNTSSAPSSNMFGQAIQQPQSGLFSKPGGGLFNATTSAPTTASNSLFSQPASSNLFGAPKPTGLFGAPTTQQSGGLFGQPSTGFGVAGSGILGANKPASSAFGQVSQPNIFGQPPQQQGGGLFGSISTSAPTFGSTTNSTSMFGGSTISSFGGFNQQPQQPQTGGIFGPKPVQPSFGGFGNAQQPPPSFGSGVGTGGSIFGPQPTTGGLFGQANTGLQKPSSLFPGQQAQQSNLFQNTQQTLGSPNLLLGSNINTAAFQQAIIESQLSSLPYGDSPLLKISTSPRKSVQDISSLQRQITFGTKDGQKSTSPQNSFLADISVVSTISKSNQDLSKEYSNGETIFDGSLGYRPIIILPSVGFGAALGLRHEPKLTKSWTSEKSFISGKSSLHMSFAEDDKRIKSLDMSVVFEPSSNEDHSFIGEKPQINAVVVPLQLSPSNESERPTIEEIPAPNETPPSKVFIQQDKQQSTNTQPVQQQQQQKKYKIKLTRPEYYSEPSIEDLECLFNSNGICIIEGGLTVGRLGYGSVFWRGPIELKEPIDLDEIVHFRNKEVIVYPDENKKPEIGYGLNKPAEVSLDNVWPIDPRTKMPIKDADELRKMNFKGKLERLCARMDASFCDYQPFSGTWQFQVQHFSKYGFHEEDDEDDNIDIQQQQQQMDVDKIQSAHLQNLIQKAKVPLREIQKTLDGRNNKREYIQQQEIDEILQIDEDNLKKGFDRRDIVGLDEDSKLFQEQIIRKKLRFDDTLFDSSKLLNIVTNKEQEQQQTLQQKPTLVERSPKNRYEGLSSQNLSKSFLKKCGINFQLPSCRIGFNQDLVFAAIPPSTHLNVVNIYQTRVIVPTVKNFFLQYIRQNNLNQQQSLQNLELSELVKFDPPSPILCYLDEFLTCSFESNKNIDKSFAGICKILLMNIRTIEDKISQRILMGDWLCEQLLNEDKSINKQRKPFLKIFKFLIYGQVVKAAEYAKEANLFNLALILSLYQSPSVALVRNLVAKQLSIALKQQNVDKDYLKILQLLSGEFKTGNVGCLEGLNWLQILGILIWYHASPTTTMIECLDILQELI